MRVVIVGAGAMGSLFAAHLARTDAEVWVYDPWREHVDAIAAAGLRVRRGGEQTLARMRATRDPSEPGIADVVMVFVKFGHTQAACADARPLVGAHTLLVTLQNGLGNIEVIEAAFPDNRLLFGFTTLTCELRGPGQIEASYQGEGETHLWPRDANVDDRCERLRALLVAGGIHTAFSPDIALKIWKKIVVNCCLNTVCAITGLRVGALTDRPEAWPLLDGIADEIVAAAAHRGIPLGREEAHAFLRTVAHEAREHEPSMLIDVRHRRATEIECLNGAVLRACREAGIAAPCNEAIYALIRVIEQSYGAREAAGPTPAP